MNTLSSSKADLLGATVVVAGDPGDTTEVLTTTLRNRGARVAWFVTSGEAEAALDAADADIAIVDTAIPGSGYNVLGVARQFGIPAIALSTQASEAQRARDAGFCASFIGPVEPEELCTAVEKYRRH